MDTIEEEHEESGEWNEEPSETHHDGPTEVGAEEPEIGLEPGKEHDQETTEREQRIGRGETRGKGQPQERDEEDPRQYLQGRDRQLGPPAIRAVTTTVPKTITRSRSSALRATIIRTKRIAVYKFGHPYYKLTGNL